MLTALAATPPAAAEPARYEIDPAHSSATFAVRHFVSQVPGRFDQLSGALAYDPENPAASSVEITIDAASIDTNNPKRDTHLRSADFFDVENHPSLTFKSTAVKGAAGGLEVTGDLTIRGVTKQVTVPVTVLGTHGRPGGLRRPLHRQPPGLRGELEPHPRRRGRDPRRRGHHRRLRRGQEGSAAATGGLSAANEAPT